MLIQIAFISGDVLSKNVCYSKENWPVLCREHHTNVSLLDMSFHDEGSMVFYFRNKGNIDVWNAYMVLLCNIGRPELSEVYRLKSNILQVSSDSSEESPQSSPPSHRLSLGTHFSFRHLNSSGLHPVY